MNGVGGSRESGVGSRESGVGSHIGHARSLISSGKALFPHCKYYRSRHVARVMGHFQNLLAYQKAYKLSLDLIFRSNSFSGGREVQSNITNST